MDSDQMLSQVCIQRRKPRCQSGPEGLAAFSSFHLFSPPPQALPGSSLLARARSESPPDALHGRDTRVPTQIDRSPAPNYQGDPGPRPADYHLALSTWEWMSERRRRRMGNIWIMRVNKRSKKHPFSGLLYLLMRS